VLGLQSQGEQPFEHYRLGCLHLDKNMHNPLASINRHNSSLSCHKNSSWSPSTMQCAHAFAAAVAPSHTTHSNRQQNAPMLSHFVVHIPAKHKQTCKALLCACTNHLPAHTSSSWQHQRRRCRDCTHATGLPPGNISSLQVPSLPRPASNCLAGARSSCCT
jgi:hypothetical protein